MPSFEAIPPVPYKLLLWKWWPETGSGNFVENDCELTTARLNHVEILSRSTVGTGTSTGFGRGFIMKLDVHRTSAAHVRDRVGEFLSPVGLRNRGIPPQKLLYKRDVAWQRLRTGPGGAKPTLLMSSPPFLRDESRVIARLGSRESP